MRQAFARALCDIAQSRSDVVLMCGDLGFSVLETFRDRFPERCFNAGVAEQSMMGAAAGLAASGKTVVTYSISNFGITRCLEQFRNDVCYHGLPVISVTVGAGLAYGAQGYTHHGIEDIGFTRALPNVAVATPSDAIETVWALAALFDRRGPASLRLARGGEPAFHLAPLCGPMDQAIALHPAGTDVTLLCHGSLLTEAAAAAAALRESGVDIGLFSFPFVEPLDRATIMRVGELSRLIVTVEEHVPETGFGSAVAEILSGMHLPRARLLRLGVARNGPRHAADQHSARRFYGLDAEGFALRIGDAIKATRP